MDYCSVCRNTLKHNLYVGPGCPYHCNSSLSPKPIRCRISAFGQAHATYHLVVTNNITDLMFVLETLKKLVSSKQSSIIQSVETAMCVNTYKSACIFLVEICPLSILLDWRDDDNNTFLHLLCILHDDDDDDNNFDFIKRISLSPVFYKRSVQKIINAC